MIMIKIPW